MALKDILIHFGLTVDQKPLQETQQSVNALVLRFNQLARIATFALGAIGVGKIADASDRYEKLASRLKVVTQNAAEFEQVERGVVDIARKTAKPIEDVAELYQRYSMATAQLGLTTDETLGFTESLTKALVVGGASAGETRGVLVQLAQGMATNFKAGGQEINSLLENGRYLADLLAKSLGTDASQLKTMAKEGKLSAAQIVKAMREAGGELDKQFAKRKWKFEDIGVMFDNEWLLLMKQLSGALDQVKGRLLGVVEAVRKAVDNGEALNSLIALLIVGVGTLSVLMGALALKVSLIAAAFLGAFLIVQDFVTYLRGGKSVIGKFLEGLSWENFYLSAQTWLSKLVVLVEATIQRLVAFMAAAFEKDEVFGPLIKMVQKFTGKPGDAEAKPKGPTFGAQAEAERAQLERENPITYKMAEWYANWSGITAERQMRAREAGIGGYSGAVESVTAPEAVSPSLDMSPFVRFSEGYRPTPTAQLRATDDAVARRAQRDVAPVITNQITVQGNATPQVARDIATRTGAATADALDRGRDAVGASVGLVE